MLCRPALIDSLKNADLDVLWFVYLCFVLGSRLALTFYGQKGMTL